MLSGVSVLLSWEQEGESTLGSNNTDSGFFTEFTGFS